MSKDIIVVFGHPGAGKTFVGQILQKNFRYHFYDGDQELPETMKDALEAEATITEEMRDEFFNKLITKTKQLHIQYNKLVIAQTFIKEKYREQLQNILPDITFLLVQADAETRENRLRERKEFPLDIEYARAMGKNFDEPQILHERITNNLDGEENVIKQLNMILKN